MLKYIFAVLIPFAITWLAFSYNVLLGFGVLVAFLLFLFWWQRPNLLTIRGQNEYARGNNNKALSLLKKAHSMGRTSPANNIVYAYILLRCGQHEEAAKVLNMVLFSSRLKPAERMKAKQNLSLVRYRQGDFEEATRLMQEVFTSYKNSSVYGCLGYYKILSHAPDAMNFALEAYEFNPDDKVIVDNLIQLYIERGQIDKAKELSDKTLAAGNEGVEIFYHAGQVALALGRKQEARTFFIKASEAPRSFMTTVSEEEIEDHIRITTDTLPTAEPETDSQTK